MFQKISFAIAAVMAVIISPNAHSKENISDLMYIPAQGVFYGSTYAQYTRSTFDFANVDVKDQRTSLNQVIGFGLTDTFSYKITASTLINGKTTFDDGSADQEREGLREPAIEFKYRFNSFLPWAKKLDVALNYSPKLKDAKRPNGNLKGLNYRGNHEIGATATIGNDLSPTRSWMAAAQLSYFTETTSTPRASKTSISRADSYMNGKVNFVWQEMLKENLGTNLGASLAYNSAITSNSVKEDSFFGLGLDAEVFWNYKAKIKYFAKVELEKNTDRDVGNSEVKSDFATQASLGATYLF